MPQAILFVALRRPCPFAHSLLVLRNRPRTVQDMPGSEARHSLPGTESSDQILVGSRMRTSRIGGFARFPRRIGGFGCSRIVPLSCLQFGESIAIGIVCQDAVTWP